MIRHYFLSRVVLSTVAVCGVIAIVTPVLAVQAAAATKAKLPAAPAPAAGEIVAYESLEQQVGAEIAIETTLNTIRRGTLVKYTNPTLTLQLGLEHGSINLSVPRETIRSIRLLAPSPAAQPQPGAQPDTGLTRAKKN